MNNKMMDTPLKHAFSLDLVEPTSFFSAMPEELHIKILSELPKQDLFKASMVCRKWNDLAYDGSLWTTINVNPFYKSISNEQILKLIKCASHFLRIVNFRGCIQLTGHGLRSLSDHCPNISTLILKDCRGVSAASIAYFLQKSNHLQILDVSGLNTVKDSTLQIVNPSFDKLEKLNMSWCRNITGPGLTSLITACTNLTCLKLNGCSQLDQETMACFGSHLLKLRQLCLAACTSLTDASILAFLNTSVSRENLTHLNISSCVRLTDATLRNLAIYSPHMTHLELASCTLMTDAGFVFLLPRLRTLIYLDLEDLQHITGETVRSIANHQAGLQRLCLSNCTQVGDDAISHLIKQGVCLELQHIELDNCAVTDDLLDTIAKYLEQQVVESQSSLSQSKRERRINVEVLDCSNITETGVKKALARASPRLTIKSFYSFQNALLEEDPTGRFNDAVDNIHQFSAGVGNPMYSRSRSAGRNHPGSCIIL